MPTVVLLGTPDTKGREFDFLRTRVQAAGCATILIDAGTLGEPLAQPDITRAELAAAAGVDATALAANRDRGTAIQAMADGASSIVQRLFAEGRLHGIIGLGGSGNATLATQAMRTLPVGLPKLLVSTMASGDTRPYVGATDITLMYSVVDIAGINQISERILSNAAAAIAGMAQNYVNFQPKGTTRPLITASMFGVTTPCVTMARERLEQLGYEVLVFHATGTGGQAMEALIGGGFIAGSLDITTTELADELVGGVLSAGPQRLEAAGRSGVPQVVSLGALDMVNFGPFESVPDTFRNRNLYRHNAAVTLMRTTAQECAELGRTIAAKLNAAQAPTAVFIPLRGVSAIATAGQPFYDPAADQALITQLKASIGAHVHVYELDMDINDPRFAAAMANELHAMLQAA
ncbi:MAG: Tm-1-like ATP-binding domain-containing protein [Roseiflexaceae bacterium]|nr:Tm-1-like ATP-binding domain-containing protein [Roseiflexaceae bacterium]